MNNTPSRWILLGLTMCLCTLQGFTNDECFDCHDDESLKGTVKGVEMSLHLPPKLFNTSVHMDLDCIDCHVDAELNDDDEHPEELGRVDCSECHDDAVDEIGESAHSGGSDHQKTSCTSCHGTHDIFPTKDSRSKLHPLKVAETCGSCHQKDDKGPHHLIKEYMKSGHGTALIDKGLIVSASCVSCHGGHSILNSENPDSRTHRDNISNTCAECHVGIIDTFQKSIHFAAPGDKDRDDKPVCSNCHQAHSVSPVRRESFRNQASALCASCHEDVAETYLESFHGKVYTLHGDQVAMCHDCHGAHNILPSDDPMSTLHSDNRVQTCAKCHEDANPNFAEYRAHADYMDKENFPVLFYTFVGMTSLLVGTFVVFGLHTLLWLPRVFFDHLSHKKKKHKPASGVHIKRFDPFSRFIHLLIILCFLTLAITGMTLKFSNIDFFQHISHLLGGYQVTGFLHRFAGVVSFIYFFLHIGYLLYRKRKERWTFKWILFSSSSMVLNLNDLKDFWATVKWFLWIGPKPEYGRWTYWEKFDYIAEFWGTLVIGFTGLVLWFPEFFTGPLGLPGLFINISTIIHSYEALLATSFIFTIHFFNTHGRPDKFPMDTVIFTGSLTLEEFQEERPREYEELLREGRLDELKTKAPSKAFLFGARIFGFTALLLGTVTVIAIFLALLGII